MYLSKELFSLCTTCLHRETELGFDVNRTLGWIDYCSMDGQLGAMECSLYEQMEDLPDELV